MYFRYGISSEVVRIQINAPPIIIDGETNTHFIKYLSQILSLPKITISLEKVRNLIILN